MSLTPTNRHNPCRICENTSGSCRQGREDLSYWQCLTYGDSKKGQTVNGFKCIGQIKNGLWAQFKPDNTHEWTEQQRADWQRENQRRQQQKAKVNDERRRRSLSAVERDKGYQQLLTELTLHPDDKADLLRRGFTAAQIELSGFRSIGRYQQLQRQYSDLLPGVNQNNHLIIRDEGYLCPIRNAEGLIVACQIRLRTLPMTESSRYRWLSGDRQTLHLFPDGSNGELPLAVFKPLEKPSGIALAEGTGAKPFLVSQRLNLLTIGAAGGQWASSPNLFKQSLENADTDGKEIKIFPDAGDVHNRHVMTRWQNVVELLEGWGYEVRFGWWGQVDKSHPDIDELEDFSIIQHIKPYEFLKKGDDLSWVKPLKKLEPESKLSANQSEKSKALCQPSRGFNPHKSCKKISCQDGEGQTIRELSTSQTYEKLSGSSNLSTTLSIQENFKDATSNFSTIQEYAASTSKDLVIDGVDVARRLSNPDNTPERKRKAHDNWKKNRQFTSAIKSIDQWCQWAKPQTNSIFFGKAGLGRGKTTLLKKWVAEWKQAGDGFLCLGYRNTLLLQMCEQLGAYHLHDKEALLMRADSTAGIALCVDSLWRFSPEDFDGKILILDEVQSVIKHLLHSSTVRNRDKILGLFHEAIKRSKQVICLDGLMADWCVDYLHTICPEKQIIKAENTYQGKKPVINYLLGTVVEGEENGKIKVNDRSPWFEHLMENSVVPVVCADSQALIEALDNIFSERGLKVLRIDSKTVPEAYVKEFLKNCNGYIKKHRPDVLLYTPSAESGVDVSIPDYFTEHFAFFFGVLDVDSMLQMLGRIRDDITKYVWCKSFVSADEKQHSKSPFADTIQKSLNQLLLGDISTSITDQETWNQEIIKHLTEVVANSNNIDTRLSTLIQSIQNFEKNNLRECLKEALLESGYTVKDCTLESSNHGKKAKEETEAVKRRNATDIFKAEKIPFELLKELGFDSKWEDRCKVMQAQLRKRLPGIDETETWTEEFIYLTKYGDRDFLSRQEMFWLFNNPEIAKHQSQKQFHWMAKKLSTFIGNYKSRWAKINALHQIGLPEFLDSREEWTNDTPELVQLCKKAKAHSNALGWQGKLSNVKFLGNLLNLIGLKLKSRKIGQNIRCYHINREVVNDPIRVQVLACIERKFAETPAENLTQNDWENAKNEAHGILPVDAPQTQTEQGVQAETHDPNFVYRNQGSCVSRNLEEKASEIQEDLTSSNVAIEFAEGSEVEPLAKAFEVLASTTELLAKSLSTVESVEEFQDIAEWFEPAEVLDAIALLNDPIKQNQLEAWMAGSHNPVDMGVDLGFVSNCDTVVTLGNKELIGDYQVEGSGLELEVQVSQVIEESLAVAPPALPEATEELSWISPKVGDKVFHSRLHHTRGFGPFIVEAINGLLAKVEMFAAPIPLGDLEMA